MLYVYPCVLEAEDEGGFSVYFPDLPEALTCGDDRQSALEMAEVALVVPLGARIDDRKHIPRAKCCGARAGLACGSAWIGRQACTLQRDAEPRLSPLNEGAEGRGSISRTC